MEEYLKCYERIVSSIAQNNESYFITIEGKERPPLYYENLETLFIIHE